MKRLFILSAAVAALASCSNSEVITEVNEPQVPDKAIAFETFSSNATRAENSNASQTEGLNLHHDDFSVWGYKDVSTTAVFDRQTVNYNSSSTKWEYSPIRFWDKGANKYEFYACAPKDESTSNSVFTLKPKSESSNTSYTEAYYFITGPVTLKAETLDK
ncbi:MAG: fimbrillin family protein, partial [Bacteroidaceae bacterium]|nr:fimbrillin family protein [Bacteroidaceae bacterium]